ncbi:hypothetical protein DH2020_022086 [Rehmannia glutinosa]|uniref:NAD(P)H dehydrogenase (quinone) n=1 Tax=Rehmannia glutinosa TaxID=99300 RepID=A0ABR0WCD7_REHGL
MKLIKTKTIIEFGRGGVTPNTVESCTLLSFALLHQKKIDTTWYYSLYGHVETMAREIQRGANAIPGVEATLWQVPETLPNRVLEKMKAPGKADDVPEIRPEQLVEADGFLFGFPSRFGVMAAQCKAFFDAANDIWAKQALAGKPAGIFWSTGFHGGGQELTALTAVTQLAHHGMIYVPMGYTFGSGMFEMEQVKGGSPCGAELMLLTDRVNQRSLSFSKPFIRVSMLLKLQESSRFK